MGNSKSKRTKKDEYSIVFLGIGQSGKSTILRQLETIYNKEEFINTVESQYINIIRQNIVKMIDIIFILMLVETYDENDDNVFENEVKNNWTQLIKSSYERSNIWNEINSLIINMNALKEGKPINETQEEMIEKLTDIIQNRIPKIQNVLRQ
eukprot:164146_1